MHERELIKTLNLWGLNSGKENELYVKSEWEIGKIPTSN